MLNKEHKLVCENGSAGATSMNEILPCFSRVANQLLNKTCAFLTFNFIPFDAESSIMDAAAAKGPLSPSVTEAISKIQIIKHQSQFLYKLIVNNLANDN